jgi:hypothetical protein
MVSMEQKPGPTVEEKLNRGAFFDAERGSIFNAD